MKTMACTYCEREKEKKGICYEDKEMLVFIEQQPCAQGHLVIAPKSHVPTIRDCTPEVAKKLLRAASACSTAVFELAGAHGTNILCTEGVDEHFAVHVIPRKTEDGLDFRWQPKQVAPEEMDSITERLKDKAFYIGKKKQETVMVPDAEEVKKDTEEFFEEEENYLIKHVQRIP